MLANDMVIFFLQIAIMLMMALLCGQISRKLRFPAVIGELIGGIILGPTIWGLLNPVSHGWLFPAAGPVSQGADELIQLCMLFFLFAAGLEMNLGLIRKERYGIAWTSVLGIVIPFALGFLAVLLAPGFWGAQSPDRQMLFAAFMGVALSISALPVIARILLDLGLMHTDVGMTIMGSAIVNDLIGWSLFALVLSSFTGIQGLPWYVTLALVFVLFAVMLTAGRYACRKAQEWLKAHLPWPGVFLGLAIALVLLVSALAEMIGVHAVFGAFLVGAALSGDIEKRNEAHEIVYQFVMYFFAPLYFVSVGLRADFIHSFDPVLVAVVIVIASIGKVAGAALGARIGHFSPRQALSIGFAMNARGAMEIILATVAKDAGLIDDRIFVALVVTALVTSMLSGPAIQWLSAAKPETPRAVTPIPYKRMADFEDPFPREED